MHISSTTTHIAVALIAFPIDNALLYTYTMNHQINSTPHVLSAAPWCLKTNIKDGFLTRDSISSTVLFYLLLTGDVTVDGAKCVINVEICPIFQLELVIKVLFSKSRSLAVIKIEIFNRGLRRSQSLIDFFFVSL